MSKKTKNILCFLFLPAFLCVSNGALAAAREMRAEGGRRGGNMSNLNLTTEQKKEIIDSRDERRDEVGAIRRALKEKRHELLDELKKDDMDSARIDSTVSEMKALQGKLIDNRVDSFLNMKKVLTKEQLEELFNSYKKEK